MSKTIDISVENNGTEVIIVSLERVGVEARVGNVERSITVDFGSLPQNIYWDEILDKPNFHPVATSGDYDDLENKPNLHQVATTGDYQDLENKPNLSEVATSGDYGDLTGKPRINNVTLDGNKSAANLGLATAAQGAKADTAYQKPVGGIPGSDMSAAVQSALEKAETALQEHQSLEGYATEAWVEDQGYLTQHQDISGKADKVANATNNNLASFDISGNLKDSGFNVNSLSKIRIVNDIEAIPLDVMTQVQEGDVFVEYKNMYLPRKVYYVKEGTLVGGVKELIYIGEDSYTIVTYENLTYSSTETINLATASQAVPSGGTTGQVLAKASNSDNDVEWVEQTGGCGTGDYEDLDNLPSINNVELIGNKTASDLGLQTELTIDATPTEGSTNPVQSGGVYEALAGKPAKISVEGIDNLTAEELASLEGGDVVLDITPRIPKAYIVMSSEAGITILANINTVEIEVVRYQSDAYQSTETLTYDSLLKKPTRWNGGLLLTYNQDGYIAESGIDEDDVATTSDLAGKQDTISDLATIRSGAALGATAIQSSEKGANNGVATLDSGGKVPQSQLPSYVDDVLEYANLASFPATGESGKIYVALDTNKTYRWSGSAYVEIAQGLALGETSSTAFAGDRGKAIEDKIPSAASSSNKLATASDVSAKSTVTFRQW